MPTVQDIKNYIAAGAKFALTMAAASDGVLSVEQAAANVANLMNDPSLPTKADGSAFTDAELHEAALAAEKPFQDVIDRDSDPATPAAPADPTAPAGPPASGSGGD